MSQCTKECWTPALCPVHGNEMEPRGRSVGPEVFVCCDNRMDPEINPRHLFDVHDDTRIYVDPDGWAEHLSGCGICWECAQ